MSRYDTDFYTWTRAQAEALRHKDWAALDVDQRPRRGWRLTIRHARREIARLLRKNPGLQYHPARYLAEAYRHARADAPDATRQPPATFPEACPWPIEQVLAEDFWPEADPRC